MNLRHKNYKITKAEEELEATESAKPLRKKINDKLGKNKAVIYYNDKIFKFTLKDGNHLGSCGGCFFCAKNTCPRSYDEDFPCGPLILKLVKLK